MFLLTGKLIYDARDLCPKRKQRSAVTLFEYRPWPWAFPMGFLTLLEDAASSYPDFPAAFPSLSPSWLRYLRGADFPNHLNPSFFIVSLFFFSKSRNLARPWVSNSPCQLVEFLWNLWFFPLLLSPLRIWFYLPAASQFVCKGTSLSFLSLPACTPSPACQAPVLFPGPVIHSAAVLRSQTFIAGHFPSFYLLMFQFPLLNSHSLDFVLPLCKSSQYLPPFSLSFLGINFILMWYLQALEKSPEGCSFPGMYPLSHCMCPASPEPFASLPYFVVCSLPLFCASLAQS